MRRVVCAARPANLFDFYICLHILNSHTGGYFRYLVAIVLKYDRYFIH
jgi:hypothetical protein